MNQKQFLFCFALFLTTMPLMAASQIHYKKSAQEPVVPQEFTFVRTLDVDGYLEDTSDHGTGAQSLRARLRYRDPDVDAFVGLLTGVSRFNNDLLLGDMTDPHRAKWLWNWGGDFGIVRGKHLWEVDLMGALIGPRVAPALAIVGEHYLTASWMIYHRTEGNFFIGDTVVDADQGVDWMAWRSVGITAGYRLFAAKHISRNGPHIGFRCFFDNPKIPFIFPSMG